MAYRMRKHGDESANQRTSQRPDMGAVEVDVETKNPDFTCICCGNKYKKNDGFIKSRSPIYAHIKIIPVCRDCLNKIYKQYLISIGNADEALKRVCSKFDIYYNQTLADASSQYIDNRMTEYVKMTALKHYYNKTYDNTVAESEEELNALLQQAREKYGDTDPKVVEFWGEGFEPADYAYLQERYDDWTANNECATTAQELIFRRICFTELNILKAEQSHADTKNLDKALQDWLNSANLKPIQKAEEDSRRVEYSLGEEIKRFEDDDPIPEVDPEFDDVDGIKKYIKTFFFGHLCEMLKIDNDYAREYRENMDMYTVTKPEYDDDDAVYDGIFTEKNNQLDDEY